MRRLLSNHWFQALALPTALALSAWVSNYLWGQVDNAPVLKRVEALEQGRAASDTKLDGLDKKADYLIDRVDAIYDRLPAPKK